MRKTNQVLQSILPHIAEEDIPAREIDLWPAIQAHLRTGLLKPQTLKAERKPVRTLKRQLRYAALAAFVLLVLLLATLPEGH